MNQEIKDLKCIIHKNNGMNECLCSIDIPKSMDITDDSVLPEFIIVLDISGSMFECLPKILKKSIPRALDILKYKKKKIHLLTFAGVTNEYSYTVAEFRKSPIEAYGQTFMAPTFPILERILEEVGPEKNFRILTMTDGVLFDQETCKTYADYIYQMIYDRGYNINSRVGRMMAEGIDPNEVDTETLLSVARFSALTFSKDVAQIEEKWSEEKIGVEIAKLFQDDGLEQKFILRSVNQILKLNPIDQPDNEIILNTGNTKFWVSKSNIESEQGNMTLIAPTGTYNVIINFKNQNCEGNVLNMVIGEDLTTMNYINIYGDKLPNMIQASVANKIHNSDQSRQENQKLLEYFTKLEENLPGPKENCIAAKCFKDVVENDNLNKISNEELKNYINNEVKKNLDNAKNDAEMKYRAKLPFGYEKTQILLKDLEDFKDLLELFMQYCATYKKLAIDASNKTLFRKSDSYLKMKDNYVKCIREAYDKIQYYVNGDEPPDIIDAPMFKLSNVKNLSTKIKKQKTKFEFIKLVNSEIEIIVKNSALISDLVPTIEWLSIPLCDRNTEKGRMVSDPLEKLVDTGKKIKTASITLQESAQNN